MHVENLCFSFPNYRKTHNAVAYCFKAVYSLKHIIPLRIIYFNYLSAEQSSLSGGVIFLIIMIVLAVVLVGIILYKRNGGLVATLFSSFNTLNLSYGY